MEDTHNGPRCCDQSMKLVGKQRVLVDLQPDDFDTLSDGQMADYFAEEMSGGDYQNWGQTELYYNCTICKKELIMVCD